VLHDLSLAAEFTDRSVVLDGSGVILADDETSRVLESPALGRALGVRFGTAVASDGRRIPLPMKS
jgi:ABC-type hemin transport system ATPase subunit